MVLVGSVIWGFVSDGGNGFQLSVLCSAATMHEKAAPSMASVAARTMFSNDAGMFVVSISCSAF